MQATKSQRRRGKTRTSREHVYQCIVDMYCENPNLPISKQTVADRLGVPFKSVEVHVDRLFKDDFRIDRPIPGFYVPLHIRPDRSITMTHVVGGEDKLEIGDAVISLTPTEKRRLIMALGGMPRQEVLREIMEIDRELRG